VLTPFESIDLMARATVAAFLNSLWGGIALTGLVGCLLHVVRRTNATTRYLIWWATLLVLVCLPLLAGLIPLAGSGGGKPTTFVQHSVTTSPETSGNPVVIATPSEQAVGASSPLRDFDTRGDHHKGREVSLRQSPGSATVSRNHDPSNLPSSPFQRVLIFLQSAVRNLRLAIAPLFPFEFPPGRWALVLFAVWALVALAGIVRVVWSYLYLQRLKGRSESMSPRHQCRLRQWLLSLHVERSVRLCTSSEVRVPVTLGLTNAVILFPKDMADHLTEAEFNQVGLHELAHIRRWDDWTNLGQKLIESVLFFHPAVLWIGRQLNLEREIACDDWVVSLTGEPRPYAACLTKLVELTALPQRLDLAPGAVTVRKHLSRRVEMLLNKKREPSVRLCKLGLLISLGVLIAGALQFSRLIPLIALAEPRRSADQSEQGKASVVAGRLENQQGTAGLRVSKAEVAEHQGGQRQALGEGLERAAADLRNEADQGKRILNKQMRTIEKMVQAVTEQLHGAENQTHALDEQFLLKAQRAVEVEEKVSELTEQLKGTLYAAQDPSRKALPDVQGREFNLEQQPQLGQPLQPFGQPQQQQQQPGQSLQQRPGQPQTQHPFPLNPEAWDFEDGFEFDFGGQKLDIPESELLPQLVKIARTDANAEVRREALRAIARLHSEASVDALISIYDASKDGKTKEWIIRGLASNGSKKAAQKLVSIAQSDSDPQMRLQALRRLGDLAGSSHPEFFSAPRVGRRVHPPKPPNPPNPPTLAPAVPPAPAESAKPQEPAK